MISMEQEKLLMEESAKVARFFIKNFLLAGRANKEGKRASYFNQEELKKGIQIEYEHTKSTFLAMRIAMDHLAEIPDYYTRLIKMENDAKEEMK